jgi:membrane protease YdiL (CAAX protease family)
MNSVALRAAVVLLVVAGAALFLGPLLRPPPTGSLKEAFTQAHLNAWMNEDGATVLVLWVVKGALALVGVYFLVRELLRVDRALHRASAPALEPLEIATPLETLWLALLLPLGVQLVLTGLFPPGKGRPVGELEFNVIVTVASSLPPALIIVLRRLRLGGASLPSVGRGAAAGVAFASIATLLVLPIQLGWVVALDARGLPLEVQGVVSAFIRPEAPHVPWLMGVFGVFVAPFTEEAIFRGLLYPTLRRRLPGGPFAAAVLVSLLFAAIHNSLLAFVPLFALAMVLAWTMERTGSLLACVVVHAIHNASSVVPLLLRHAQGS